MDRIRNKIVPPLSREAPGERQVPDARRELEAPVTPPGGRLVAGSKELNAAQRLANEELVRLYRTVKQLKSGCVTEEDGDELATPAEHHLVGWKKRGAQRASGKPRGARKGRQDKRREDRED
ncbi:MAG: hypothetical protein JWP36_2918 [Paucimonas sp.]|jgi:hypothetical protein|nr:hypothetical protein [Paucimonas sp.]